MSTFEFIFFNCVVLALLDVGVKLPGENHHELFHLQEKQNSRFNVLVNMIGAHYEILWETQRSGLYRWVLKMTHWGSYLILGVGAEWKADRVGGYGVSTHRGRRQSCSRGEVGHSQIVDRSVSLDVYNKSNSSWLNSGWYFLDCKDSCS